MMRRHVLFAVIALAATACRERANVGNGPFADKVADDIPQIENALGVKFKAPPKLELRTRDQVREFLLQRMQDTAVKKDLANQEAVFRVLGLIPDTMNLTNLYVKLLTEQIIGYYDPKTKVLYVVNNAPDEYTGITIMHELIHALQDQYTNLDSLEHITGDDDRAAAASAVVEGQATYESLYLLSGGSGNIAAQFPGGWDAIRQTIRENMKTQPVFSSAPLAIQESMLFPYINGADFVRRFKAHEGKKMPFDSLPISTKQLMHDSAYFAKTRDVPSTIVLPPIPGTVDQNDFGEFGTRIYLYAHTRNQDMSIRASNGWDGDRYALVKTPKGDALVWATVWDTRQDGVEFIDAVDQVMRERFNRLPRITAELRHFESPTRTIDVDVREINGRPVVLYVDVPAGESTNLVDFAKVHVTPR
ncbi:MAG TPA: hypothetical protein VN706_23630 [Gemmatimonadaceae bacterium]|nr:hypothetical protein [Gemmatimonadaceae bacterium]